VDWQKIFTSVILVLITSLIGFSTYLVNEIQELKIVNADMNRYIIELGHNTNALKDHETRLRYLEHQK